MKYAIAVLDIGKTNKKVVVFDDSLKPVDSVYKSIPTIIRDGLDVEDVDSIEKWFLDTLKEMAGKHEIKVISISAHGATCACVDSRGELALPVISYTNEVEEGVHEDFFGLMGEEKKLQSLTGTAHVRPLINLGKMLFFMKRRFPGPFEKTDKILLYPQYFGYRLTGRFSIDYTYVGCHSYLWDFKKWDWSPVNRKLGIAEKLPRNISCPGDILGTLSREAAAMTGLNSDTLVTVGIHDSNSSLIPYLIRGDRNFILNSTGTWCVAMHRTPQYSLCEDDLGKTVFYNISAGRDLVKTAIFMGGLEFEYYMNHLRKLANRSDYPDFDIAIIQKAIDRGRDFIIPGIMHGAGQFPESKARVLEGNAVFTTEDLEKGIYPRFFEDYEYAYAVLNLSLALQTGVSFDRLKAPEGTPVYIEGGFRNNRVYMKLLATLYNEAPLFSTDISEATALGAAVLGKAAFEKTGWRRETMPVSIEKTKIEPETISGLNEYARQFLAKV